MPAVIRRFSTSMETLLWPGIAINRNLQTWVFASENYTMIRHNTATTVGGLFKGRWPSRAKHCPQKPASAQ
jgi:hypothetical protein